jgi:uncharacterized membrane protein YjjP (DUF1212 family)
MIRRLLLSTTLSILSVFALAQNPAENTGMADTMRSNGKIYVVVAVILTIFAGIIIYLVRLDRKMSKLEKSEQLSGSSEKL